jgi:hypothetical protein
MFAPDLIENFGDVPVGMVAPLDPQEGDLWFDSTPVVNALKIYVSNAWSLVGSGGVSAALPAASAQGQILVSGSAPAFDWTVQQGIDQGRF